MSITEKEYEITSDCLFSVEQSIVQTVHCYFRQYINSSDAIPFDIKQAFDDQLIETIALSPEILLSPPSILSLKNKSKIVHYFIFTSYESMAVFPKRRNLSSLRGDEYISSDSELPNNNEEEICTFREIIWKVLTKAVHDRVRLYLGESNDEYLWTSVYSEQNLEELLEYIGKLMHYSQKFFEHSFRGEEIYPDDLLCILNNPYSEYDPLDYIEQNICMKESDISKETSNKEHD